MSKFILFSHHTYYPYGGMGDCEGVFDTLQDALAAPRFGPNFEVLQVPEMIVHEQDGRAIPITDYIKREEE